MILSLRKHLNLPGLARTGRQFATIGLLVATIAAAQLALTAFQVVSSRMVVMVI